MSSMRQRRYLRGSPSSISYGDPRSSCWLSEDCVVVVASVLDQGLDAQAIALLPCDACHCDFHPLRHGGAPAHGGDHCAHRGLGVRSPTAVNPVVFDLDLEEARDRVHVTAEQDVGVVA